MTEVPIGRRERKKAATRQALADAALRLFLEHGYDQVGIRDIAEAADVSTTTLFKHFSGKEALVFDQEEGRDEILAAVVRDRPPGRDVLDALREHVLATWLPIAEHPLRADFVHLVDGTPALRAYSERMWTRHAGALGAAIAAELGAPADDLACVTLARFVLEIPALTSARPDRRAAVETIFDLLANGWKNHPGVRVKLPNPEVGDRGAQAGAIASGNDPHR
ncbi:TetR/AcrR family transcriptional regulator [Actinoplanes sp. L3-i22]|uniref:TetR/AcrR family transcriptional regulator n=1 Tax=Actinoplanes sp. L3-i22 TaxID=2836373 RepID=UPI001C765952|nr:TetR/AcrR family transcriptional regulator [Actinoplanes sp. L3-i22]BCY13219.1 TetR family transcriptional regulator [Actinoplanes sp. L3-i22]